MNKTTIATFIILIALAFTSLFPSKTFAQSTSKSQSQIQLEAQRAEREICSQVTELADLIFDARELGYSRAIVISAIPDDILEFEHGDFTYQLFRQLIDYIYDRPRYISRYVAISSFNHICRQYVHEHIQEIIYE